MSHYPLEELIARWTRADLTTEQMIGQMLQVLKQHEQRLKELARREPPDGAAPQRPAPKK